MMKVLRRDAYGAPGRVLKVEERPTPTDVEADHVLVRVKASSVNSGDYRLVVADPPMVRGLVGLLKPKAKDGVTGQDVAGVVERVGPAATFAVGDAVVGWSKIGGAQAEFVVVPSTQLVKKPENVSFVAASTIPMAAITALEAVRDVGKMQQGDRVLVVGASGGCGMFAVQMARSMGASDVVAVCSGRNVDLCKSFGASECIDYKNEHYGNYSGAKFDVIIFIGGKFTLRGCLRILKPHGRVAVVSSDGTMAGLPRLGWALFRNALFHRREVKMFVSKELLSDVEECVKMLGEGKIKPHVDKTFPLEEGVAAYEFFTGAKQGKVVITMDEQ